MRDTHARESDQVWWQALEAVFRRDYHRLVRSAAFVVDRETAHDCVQSAFLRVWQHRDRYSLEETPECLVRRVVRNLALDERKRLRRAGHNADIEITVRPPDDNSPVPLIELQDEFQVACAKLSRPERGAVWHVIIRQVSVEEAARTLHVTEKTVRNLVASARNHLRQAMLAPVADRP